MSTINGDNVIRGLIKSTPKADGGALLICRLTYSNTELPGCCGIRIIKHLHLTTENLIELPGLAAKAFGNCTLRTSKDDWGNGTLLRDYVELINSISKEERQEAMERLFKQLLADIDAWYHHQYILSDQLTHNEPADTITRYFVEWLQKNKHGKIYPGPVTFNGNYVSRKASFVRTWTWIPPSKPVLHIKHGKIAGISLTWALKVRTNILISGFGTRLKTATSSAITKYLKDVGWNWEHWKKENLNANHKYTDRFN